MTYLALNLSHYVNGVAKRHGEVSRLMFAGYDIDAITNGVHATTLDRPDRFSRAVRSLHPRLARGQLQPALRAEHSAMQEIWQAHGQAKRQLHRSR